MIKFPEVTREEGQEEDQFVCMLAWQPAKTSGPGRVLKEMGVEEVLALGAKQPACLEYHHASG